MQATVSRKDELILDLTQLFMKVAVIMVLYQILSIIPPLKKLTLPDLFVTPLDILKTASYCMIATTIFLSQNQISNRIGVLTSEKTLIADIYKSLLSFTALLFVYFGFKDLIFFADNKPLEFYSWFLWPSVLMLATPLFNAGIIIYKNTEKISLMIAEKRWRKEDFHGHSLS